ncbi:MAG: hypothetical protein F6J95_002315 [Leptolyngbya sp. SIO1E4]|nr:hypothetical protein [Leptolyngbya sp. SIO1E4]
MTLPSEDDRLVDFLRRHRPEAPKASPELEAQIMASVQADMMSCHQHQRDRPAWRRRFAIPALAASVLLVWGGSVGVHTQQRQTERAAMDAFLMDTWYGSAYGDDTYRLALDTAEPSWLLSVYATPY